MTLCLYFKGRSYSRKTLVVARNIMAKIVVYISGEFITYCVSNSKEGQISNWYVIKFSTTPSLPYFVPSTLPSKVYIMESYSGSCRSSDGVRVNINSNVDLICAQINSLRDCEPWKMTCLRAWIQNVKDSTLRISCEYNRKYLIMRNGERTFLVLLDPSPQTSHLPRLTIP